MSGSGLISSSCPSSSHFLTEEGQEVPKDHLQHTEGRSRAGRQPAWSWFLVRRGPPVPSGSHGTGCYSLGGGTWLRPPFLVRAPPENCAHAPCVVAAQEPRSSESLVPEAPLCSGRCVLSTGQLPAVPGVSASLCLARWVECPTQRFEMLRRAFTAEQTGQPLWAGPWACGGPSSFGASCVTAEGGGPAYLQPHLPGCGQAACLAHWAPESGLLPRTAGRIRLSGYCFGRWQLPEPR